MATPTGRPPKYDSPDEMETKINEYFTICDEGKTWTGLNKKGDPVTYKQPRTYSWTGLALHLGFNSTEGLRAYKAKSKGFTAVLTRAKARIEEAYIHGGTTGTYTPRFTEFLLRCHYDYKDKQTLELTGKDGGPVELKKILDETDGSTRGLPKEKVIGRDMVSRPQSVKSTGYASQSGDGEENPGGDGQKPAGKSVKGR